MERILVLTSRRCGTSGTADYPWPVWPGASGMPSFHVPRRQPPWTFLCWAQRPRASVVHRPAHCGYLARAVIVHLSFHLCACVAGPLFFPTHLFGRHLPELPSPPSSISAKDSSSLLHWVMASRDIALSCFLTFAIAQFSSRWCLKLLESSPLLKMAHTSYHI